MLLGSADLSDNLPYIDQSLESYYHTLTYQSKQKLMVELMYMLLVSVICLYHCHQIVENPFLRNGLQGCSEAYRGQKEKRGFLGGITSLRELPVTETCMVKASSFSQGQIGR